MKYFCYSSSLVIYSLLRHRIGDGSLDYDAPSTSSTTRSFPSQPSAKPTHRLETMSLVCYPDPPDDSPVLKDPSSVITVHNACFNPQSFKSCSREFRDFFIGALVTCLVTVVYRPVAYLWLVLLGLLMIIFFWIESAGCRTHFTYPTSDDTFGYVRSQADTSVCVVCKKECREM